MKKIKNTLIYLAIVAVIRLLRSMDRMTAIGLMRHVGRLAFLFAVRERNNAISHLTLAFGREKHSDEIRRLAKKVFLTLSACAADAVRLPLMVKDGSIDRLVTLENFHYFKDAVNQGRGVIIMTGHYGNWELMGTWVVRHGYPIKVVAKKSYDPRLDKLIVGYRNEAGYANTARGNAATSVVEGLMNGETYGLLFDLDTKVKGVFVDFFGRPAHTATVPALLSMKLKVPIVPMFIRLTEDYRYVITCLEPPVFADTGDEEKDVRHNTLICSKIYEQVIRAHPEQWIWMHRRWKKQPKTDQE
ncbi:lysophospholipid acyltransferase family protein [Desulfatiferula olefinivorans]